MEWEMEAMTKTLFLEIRNAGTTTAEELWPDSPGFEETMRELGWVRAQASVSFAPIEVKVTGDPEKVAEGIREALIGAIETGFGSPATNGHASVVQPCPEHIAPAFDCQACYDWHYRDAKPSGETIRFPSPMHDSEPPPTDPPSGKLPSERYLDMYIERTGRDMSELPRAYGGRPFRAVVVAHNDRGGSSLCIGAEGYHPESYVVLTCTEEERRRFPIGTQFDLVCVEETRGIACELCGGSGRRELTRANDYIPGACVKCRGSGRESA
jgi:hypothetical protein